MTTATTSISVNAGRGATAWLNAFLASGQDDSRTALNRTLCVEFFENGVHFVGCDGTILLRTWVPSTEHDDAPFPGIDEIPDETVVVMDPDKFAVGFVRALLAASKDAEFSPMSIAVEPAPTDEPALGESLAADMLTLHAFGQRLHCRLYDGAYPDWRRLQFGIATAELVDGMTLAPRMFATVGKLRDVSRVDCGFSGDARQITITATGATEVRGLLMPMRRETPQQAR